MKGRCFLVLALTLVAATAYADMPKPDPMLRQLDYFAGHWTCKGIAFANPMAPEHPTRTDVRGAWVLGGHWLRIDVAEQKTAKNPAPLRGIALFGHDAEQKKIVVGWVDNMGGYSTGASDGWSGDAIVFSGPMHFGGMTMTARDSFTRMGPNKMQHVFDVQQNGQWNKAADETCTRAK